MNSDVKNSTYTMINSGNMDLNDSEIRSYSVNAKKMLQEGNLNGAFTIFNKIHSIFGCAYCKFLAGDLEEAKILLMIIKDSSSAVNWLILLINLLQGNNNTENFPTYFQIRSFYEQDLDMLFLYKQTKLAECIINNNDYFECFNREIYKYSARVLNNYNNIEQAKEMLKKSLNIFYKDPETHYILGEIYLKMGDIKKAMNSFLISYSVSGTYLPALKKINNLSEF